MTRLFLVTGKGGVGKTLFSLALSQYLKDQKKNICYVNFQNEMFSNDLNSLEIPTKSFDILESTETYIGKKLNSAIIAHWVMKTPFFNSLLQILPGLQHLITLGHIIDHLEKNPDLVMVLDSPATGHAVTMLKTCSQFKKIFKFGPLVKDIERIELFLATKDQLQIFIMTLAQELPLSEANDLESEIHKIGPWKTKIILNQSLIDVLNESADLPEFYIKKIHAEKEILKQNPKLPLISFGKSSETPQLVRQMAAQMDRCL
jgi:arsenite-transporting ATPase